MTEQLYISNITSPTTQSSSEPKFIKKKGAEVVGDHTIPRLANRNAVPLSFAQQRLWFLEQLEPDNPFYNITRAMLLSGTLNVNALQQAFDAIVARHEVLRTTFVSVDGNPKQFIADSWSVELPVITVGEGKPRNEQDAEVQRLLSEAAKRPFNLSSDLMLRATLLRLAPEEHVLVIVIHHILSDDWSMGIIFRELTAVYETIKTGKPSPLPVLPIQYADFAVWQRQWLHGEVLAAQLAYWKQQLDCAPPVLELPTDRARPPVQTFRGARLYLVLSPSLTDALKALSKQEGVTLFMTLLAAFQILLHRYTGQDDIVVGTTIANRNWNEIMALVGLFANTLVLRSHLKGHLSFRDLLVQVRNVAWGAYTHPELPFEKLVEELQPERDLNRTPLFQVMLNFHNAPNRSALTLPGMTVTPIEVDNGTAKFDLTLTMEENQSGLRGSLEYNSDLFEAATIARMINHFQILLEGIVANPDQCLSVLPLLTDAERHQLLVEWNDTQTPYPKDSCIHQLFEAQVERTPDAIAVVFENQHLSYAALNQKANQLAHYLQVGVKPEVLVGICIERSLDMVIGLLGIIKAGGAYLPLDPAYPAARLAFMLEDAQVPVLLTQSSLVKELPKTTAQVVCLDTEWEKLSRLSANNLASGVALSNLAYVIYTSGSTGVPKGVMVEHAAITQHVNYSIIRYQIESNDNVLQFASLNFDASIEQILSTWCGGARLVLLSTNLLPAKAIQNLIYKEQITIANLPPAYWQQLLHGVNNQNLEPLKLLILGGDALSSQLTQQTRQILSSDIILLNAYGPTEATITATLFEVTEQFQDNNTEKVTPIGQPIANTQIYLLDRHQELTPIGVPGEIHIGGAGLARGYFNRPELTQEKFIPNPFSNEPEARLYKTGDLARYLPDGNIEYLGRIDNQVKIRGFRVELGEIEAVLVQHPEVREAVVIVREEHPGDKCLVAYLVQNQAQEAMPSSTLRRFIKDKLPDYMVPSAFVRLKSIPLTPNGKVDRSALPVPDQTRYDLDLDETFVAPRSPVEEKLADIWTEVLHREPIGIHDNFFELGGHSLLATQVISRISEAFAVELPLRSLFETPTVAGLAERITQRLTVAHDDMAELLAELEGLSDEEAQRLVTNEL